MNTTQLASLGRVILFCGVETQGYSLGQWENVALFARSHGIDSVLVKINDGANWWYGGPTAIAAIRNLMLSHGVGCIPYGYFYGNTYGAFQAEVDIVLATLQHCGMMCMDMEVEYDGQSGWCRELSQQVAGHAGILLCSTWADPQLQNWETDLQLLAHTFDAFMPQEYTDYLASTEYQLLQAGITSLIPTIYLGNLQGNDPYQIAVLCHNRGHAAISLWYDGFAIANPALVDSIAAVFRETPVVPITPVIPTTPPVQKETKYMEQQFTDVWNSSPLRLSMGTGIGETVKNAFLEHKIAACFPTSQEIRTVDWAGNAILYQTFSTGIHAEYNKALSHCRLYDSAGREIV